VNGCLTAPATTAPRRLQEHKKNPPSAIEGGGLTMDLDFGYEKLVIITQVEAKSADPPVSPLTACWVI